MTLHLELEERLARFKSTEAALVFQSGYTANVGVVLDPHAGRRSHRLGRAEPCQHHRRLPPVQADRTIYRHLDYDHLNQILKTARAKTTGKILVVADGVFSMDGDVSDLKAIRALCREYDAIPMVDDAPRHRRPRERGPGQRGSLRLKDDWDIQIGTMSKAFGVMGGYVCAPRPLIDFYIHKARPFLFSSRTPRP